MGSLAIAVLTNYLQNRAGTHIAALGRGAAHAAQVGLAHGGEGIPAAVLAAQATAYHDTYLLVSVLVLPAFVAAFLIRRAPAKATDAQILVGQPATTPRTGAPGKSVLSGSDRGLLP